MVMLGDIIRVFSHLFLKTSSKTVYGEETELSRKNRQEGEFRVIQNFVDFILIPGLEYFKKYF